MTHISSKISSSHFFFDWEIPNFCVTTSHYSPKFNCFGATWRLKIHERLGDSEIYLDMLKTEHLDLSVNYQIVIKGSDGIDYLCKQGLAILASPSSIQIEDIHEVSTLLNKLDTKGTTLKISCIIWNYTDATETLPQNSQNDLTQLKSSSLESLSDNLKDLFLSQRNSDVIIKVKEHQIHAHKAILEARSKVLAAMIQHDMKDNCTGIIEIYDFEPEEVKDFFYCMYCGDVDILKSGNVFKIYKLSDKYDMEDMKRVCVKFMELNVDVENICETLFIAENYDEEQLKEVANVFLARHLNEILSSHQWEVFSKENSFIAHCILKKIIFENAWKIKAFYET